MHAAEVPEGIRRPVLAAMQPGDTLWRQPALSGAKGPLAVLGIGRREVPIAWWLIGADGELIDAYWEE